MGFMLGPRRCLLPRAPLSARDQLWALLNDGNTVANYIAGVGTTGTLTLTNWANQIGAAPELAEVGGSGPIIVSNDWVPKLYLPGVAGNTVTTGTKTVTGSQTFTFSVALDDYTPAADVTLFSKSSGNDGFIVKWLTTDKVRLVVGDGVSLTNVDVVAASSFTDGSQHTITIAWADGVGATFSYDGVVSGSQVAAAKTLTNAAVDLTIGSTTSKARLLRLQVGSVYDMNAADSAETSTNAATFVSSTTGETYTLNNTGATPAQIARSPQYLFNGTSHYLTMSTTLVQPAVFMFIGSQITNTVSDSMTDGVGTHPDGRAIIQQRGTTNLAMYAGNGYVPDGTGVPLALNTKAILTAGFSGVNSYLKINNGAASTGDQAGTSNPNGLHLGSDIGGTNNSNIQCSEFIILNALPSAAVLAQIIALEGAIHGIAV